MIRVLPRDAFNDANLLKCIGQLTMLIEDGMLPDWSFEYDGKPFDIRQDENSGETCVINICFMHKGEHKFVFRPMNSRDAWPLWVKVSEDDIRLVFNEKGEVFDI